MKTLRLEIELAYDDEIMHGDDRSEMEWFKNIVLLSEPLALFSNIIGDEIGTVKVISINEEAK